MVTARSPEGVRLSGDLFLLGAACSGKPPKY